MKTEKFNLDDLNFDSLVKKSEKRKSIYKYSDALLNDPDYKTKMKIQRKQNRNYSLKICLQVVEAFKSKNPELIEKAKKDFNQFYTENFVTNDYSYESFSQVSVKEDPLTHQLYSVTLALMKEANEEIKEVKEKVKK